eukprot:CAMPEP_0170096754 /NCGR_PEP_ID=MMETSP0019_2-20121128/28784_1 /TAXON_ID=98059 /ORGANISM="Dinobryon sp., Strain UTEXLB2267" /LENGTH=68 /DNA_ID=CAMNT_0010318825 /DNA_START=103 /DNA_END=306 /DNA_ORIENTATION=+
MLFSESFPLIFIDWATGLTLFGRAASSLEELSTSAATGATSLSFTIGELVDSTSGVIGEEGFSFNAME